MSEIDYDKLAEAIKAKIPQQPVHTLPLQPAAPPEASKTSALMDSLQKIAVTLSTLGMIWAISSLTNLHLQVALINSQLVDQQKVLERLGGKFESFADRPRFTKEDFDIEIRPIRDKITAHETRLASRNESADRLENQANQNTYKINQMSEDLNRLLISKNSSSQ